MIKTENIIRLNQVIKKALHEAAHEAKLKRIETMKTRPFDEVIQAIKNKQATGQNLANGYFVTDAIFYFDERLETEYEEIWLEVDINENNWFEAIERFRW